MFGVKYKRVTGINWRSLVVFHFTIVLWMINAANAIKIKQLSVPKNVNLHSPDTLKLECIIEFDKAEYEKLKPEELVAQWRLNETRAYQWINNNRTIGTINPTFKNRIDAITASRTHMDERSLSVPLIISKKDINLTGLYECRVQTYEAEDSQKNYMVMYVPVNNITLDHVSDFENGQLIITCGTEGVYPQPEISLVINDERNITTPLTINIGTKNQLYDINATYALPIRDLPSVANINCSIILPKVDHIFSKALQYNKSGSDDGDDEISILEANTSGYDNNRTFDVQLSKDSDGTCSINQNNLTLLLISLLTALIWNR